MEQPFDEFIQALEEEIRIAAKLGDEARKARAEELLYAEPDYASMIRTYVENLFLRIKLDDESELPEIPEDLRANLVCLSDHPSEMRFNKLIKLEKDLTTHEGLDAFNKAVLELYKL